MQILPRRQTLFQPLPKSIVFLHQPEQGEIDSSPPGSHKQREPAGGRRQEAEQQGENEQVGLTVYTDYPISKLTRNAQSDVTDQLIESTAWLEMSGRLLGGHYLLNSLRLSSRGPMDFSRMPGKEYSDKRS